MSTESEREVSDWWRSAITDMAPGELRFRGYPVEELIGRIGFAGMVWLLTRGGLPSAEQARLLESALVAGVDHGPQAPSIAIARMAVTCGVELNNAMASAINVLGDVHGGAGEQALEIYAQVAGEIAAGADAKTAADRAISGFSAAGGKYIPGFGHRFHTVDPRTAPLFRLVDQAIAAGVIEGRIAQAARALEAELESRKGRPIPMNVDGITAVIYGELGFEPPLARGFFCLSRSVGVLAHAWEQSQQGGRNKGPTPKRFRWTYDGPAPRAVDADG